MEGTWWRKRVSRPLTLSRPLPLVLQMLDEAFELAKALVKNNPGWVFIHPFDDPLIWYVEPRVTWCGWHPLPTTLGVPWLQDTSSHHYAQRLYLCVHTITQKHAHRRDSGCWHVCTLMLVPHGHERTRKLTYTAVCLQCVSPEADPKRKISGKVVYLGGDSSEEWGSEMRKEGSR